jgi:hypothetical protein
MEGQERWYVDQRKWKESLEVWQRLVALRLPWAWLKIVKFGLGQAEEVKGQED